MQCHQVEVVVKLCTSFLGSRARRIEEPFGAAIIPARSGAICGGAILAVARPALLLFAFLNQSGATVTEPRLFETLEVLRLGSPFAEPILLIQQPLEVLLPV